MGAAIGFLGKFGLPGVQAMSTDKIFDKYFEKVNSFEEFHEAFLECFNYINNAMPGFHYTLPPYKDIKEEYESKWNNPAEKENRQKSLIELLNKHMSQTADNSTVMMAGIVAPPAAVVLKRAGQNIPQIKKLRLHLVPDWVLVPVCTIIAITGAKGLQAKPKRTT
ncbi:Type III secretion system substrate exporter C-terminal protein [Dioscorea alata]|uniref:Type III secretion system substrate exporter C-terminal protein n=1 Tax=Dioscorea alata TaxID=55571 RepID=A0ACB7V5J5_DIOAL|nr:Type III secretion system substrate exporter C-terminal protein [Dioscorea alata]